MQTEPLPTCPKCGMPIRAVSPMEFIAGERFSVHTATGMTECGDAVDKNMRCPFCRVEGYDDVGLKIHLTAGRCDNFNNLSIGLPKTIQS